MSGQTILQLLAQPCVARRPGLAGYKIDRCRCVTCSGANRDYHARRDRLIAYGRWQALVDAAPVRDHIRRVLQPAGLGANRIATLSGVPRATLGTLIWGKADRRPATRIRPAAAAAILALQPDTAALADGALVDATGAVRRTQALAAIGYSIAAQAAALGRTGRNHNHLLGATRITAGVARAVDALYEQWSGTAAADTPTSRRTRRWARKRGYAPPLLWEGVDIDDPAAQPVTDGDGGEVVDEFAVQRVIDGKAAFHDLNEPEKALAVNRLRASGASRNTTAVRLRIGTFTVDKFTNPDQLAA